MRPFCQHLCQPDDEFLPSSSSNDNEQPADEPTSSFPSEENVPDENERYAYSSSTKNLLEDGIKNLPPHLGAMLAAQINASPLNRRHQGGYQ